MSTTGYAYAFPISPMRSPFSSQKRDVYDGLCLRISYFLKAIAIKSIGDRPKT
ncbi:hypothetical protein [Anabaena lutea]|uniref:Uncharacterized protein n=1 Tax=Anabaena lutea FACHB-196 TaxID=2692881 RepID=A0ABR8FJS4_9NOST|nr:hypothetical protein [Anabaena lutea]MBD2569843.1 hypothetical protein [Anabaena lutea FACHB-196]